MPTNLSRFVDGYVQKKKSGTLSYYQVLLIRAVVKFIFYARDQEHSPKRYRLHRSNFHTDKSSVEKRVWQVKTTWDEHCTYEVTTNSHLEWPTLSRVFLSRYMKRAWSYLSGSHWFIEIGSTVFKQCVTRLTAPLGLSLSKNGLLWHFKCKVWRKRDEIIFKEIPQLSYTLCSC